ncbi:response regulator transcription factor [Chryseobacterium polytrichastri]|uniref:Regulatory protein, luxR family n=1 Tax=Chryseobacterium polytrichastri TaxID=1302687 RepID=A0A1M6XMH9_9FLAO|nr:LuxR C-terminal-related transcriptional regulator [Chryseobacterium polytrichastri]SHL07118.1 regulatory protein, luxR family [Chryseobacterium polytrichastri]
MNDIPNSLWAGNISAFPPSEQKETSKKYLEALKGLARISFGCVFILDFVNEKIEFLSENPSLFSGLRSSEVEKLGYDFYRKFTKADDLKVLMKVANVGFKFFECLSLEEKKTYSITYDFHVTNASNSDVLINHKMIPIEISENGDISKMVCLVSYSQNQTAGNICIQSNTSETYWTYNLLTGKWKEEHKITLKIREIEIIRFYLQGLKIEEIAQRLYLSPDTVKFHRRKLFEKIGVNNITEAISYVVLNKLI